MNFRNFKYLFSILLLQLFSYYMSLILLIQIFTLVGNCTNIINKHFRISTYINLYNMKRINIFLKPLFQNLYLS